MKAAWRRFRDLSVAVQACAWIVVAAAYTVGLVLVLGGGDADRASARPDPDPISRTPQERRLQRVVEGLTVRRSQPEDVVDYRRPHVVSVRCEGAACQVVYLTGLPGGGRILEDQQQIVRAGFLDLGLNSLRITVYRGSPDVTGVPSKTDEQTRAGQVLVDLACDRTKVDQDEMLTMPAYRLQNQACTLKDTENGGPLNRRGSPGTDKGDQGPTGPPPP